MTTTTVFLVRHVPHALQGRVQVGRQDGIALAEGSPEKARRVGERLARERLDAIYCSPISRARETAAAVAEPHGLEPVVQPDLSELDFGRWTGRSFDDLDADPDYRAWNAARAMHRAPGGETMLECQARMMRAVERARREHPDGRVALVSHGDPLKTVVLYLLGLPVDAYDRFDLDPGSVTGAVVGDWGAKLLFLNERPAA